MQRELPAHTSCLTGGCRSWRPRGCVIHHVVSFEIGPSGPISKDRTGLARYRPADGQPPRRSRRVRRLGRRARAGDPRRAAPGALRRGLPGDVHRHHRRRARRHRLRRLARRVARRPGRSTHAAPRRAGARGGRGDRRRCRSSGRSDPSAQPPDPPAIVVLAAAGFFLPSALLSAVTPLVVKVQLGTLAETGRVVGRISALGTAGSLVGVFATGFILVAEFATTPVVITLGALLIVAGVGPVVPPRPAPARPQAVAAGVALGVVASGVAVAAAPPCDVETAYYCATRCAPTAIGRPAGCSCSTTFATPTSTSTTRRTSSSATPNCSATSSTWSAPPAEPIDAVHLGGGGFTIPRYLAATRPGSDNLVLELDPGVIDVAEDELGLRLGPTAADRHRRRPGQPRATSPTTPPTSSSATPSADAPCRGT